jgi:hypothetical protein
MNTKPKWLRNDKRVMEWEWETKNELCVVTSYGYAFEPNNDHNMALHSHIYSTAKEARAELKDIKPCPCLRCKSLGKLA